MEENISQEEIKIPKHDRPYFCIRFRNNISYLWYIIRLNPQGFFSLILNISIFGVSLYLFAKDITTISSFLLFFTISSSIISIIQLSREGNNFIQIRKCSPIDVSFPYKEIEPSMKEKGNKYIRVVVEQEQECAFYSKEINTNLRKNQIEIEIRNEKYKKIRRIFKTNLSNQIRFLTEKKRDSNKSSSSLFVNYPKLCVSSDLTMDNTGKNGKITCHKGGYYDTYLSNIISTKLLIKDNNEEIADGTIFSSHYRSFSGNEEGKKEWRYITKDIEDSVNNNEIGISTLGFSDDKKFIIWKQKQTTQVSHNKLVPTGSGCCDYSDLVDNSLNKSIIHGMERELLEESLNPDNGSPNRNKYIKDTMILGYFRWIKRGGKSEFVGLTKLAKKRSSYEANGHEVVEARELQEENHYIETIHDIPKFARYIKNLDDISIPLYMIAVLLENYYNTNRDDLEKFLGLEVDY